MAITLQLAASLQKAAPTQSSVAATADAAVDDAAAAAIPFAAIMGDLLRTPVAPAADPAAADAVTGDLAASTEAPAGQPVDAATQALLASLSLTAAPTQQAAATDTPVAESTTIDTVLADGGRPRAAAQSPLQATVAQAPVADGEAADPSGATAGSAFAELLPATPAEQKLPEPANIAALASDAKTARLGADTALADLDTPLPPADTSHVRHAAASGNSTATPAPAATAPAHYAIPEPVASSRWSEAISQRALYMVDQQVQSAELHLNPPHLGPLEVKLALDGDKATLSFNTQQVAVRDAVQQSLPKLHQVFADNGMAEVNVQVHLGQQQQPQQQERQGTGRQYAAGDSPGGDLSIDPTGASAPSRWRSQAYATARGGVDIFA